MQPLFALVLALVAAPPPATLPVSAIHAGQQGECRTVFVGETIESVPFVVRGVLPSYLGPHADLIVIRLQGDKAEFTGVASGMSGSPCLIDGKVIGALSYSFMSFGKEPIAGVTPIADMLPLLDMPAESLPWRPRQEGVSVQRSTPKPPRGETPDLVAQALRHHASGPATDWRAFEEGVASPLAMAPRGDAMPLSTPLTLSGGSPSLLQHVAPYFSSHGFSLAAGAAKRQPSDSSRASASEPPRIVPGGSVSSVLVSGDVDMAGTGTVSWMQGEKVLAFGHPFFGVGPMSAPMAEASILQILASSQHSRKQPVIGRLVGEFTQDRLSAISGHLGEVPSMVRVSGVVHTGKHEDRFSFGVARDAFWTPRMLATGLMNALEGRVAASDRGTLRAHATVRFDGDEALSLAMTTSAERSAEMKFGPAFDVAHAFDALWSSNDAWPGEASLDINVTISPAVHEEHVEELRAGIGVAAPRSVVPLSLTLRTRGEPASVHSLEFVAPPVADGETVLVLACEGSLLDVLDDSTLGVPPLQRRSQWRRWLASRRTPGELYVQMRRFGGNAHHLQGQRLTNLPPSVAASLGDPGTHTGAMLSPFGRHMSEQHLPRPGAVRGCAVSTFTVQRPFASAGATLSR